MPVRRRRLWGLLAYAPAAVFTAVVAALLADADGELGALVVGLTVLMLLTWWVAFVLSLIHVSCRIDLDGRARTRWNFALVLFGPLAFPVMWHSLIRPLSECDRVLASWEAVSRRTPLDPETLARRRRYMRLGIGFQWVVLCPATLLVWLGPDSFRDGEGAKILTVTLIALAPLLVASVVPFYLELRRYESPHRLGGLWMYAILGLAPLGTTAFYLVEHRWKAEPLAPSEERASAVLPG